MKGLFETKEFESVSFFKGKLHSCISCGLYKSVHSPRMKPFGNFKKGILNIGEAPTEIDDIKGKQWQSKAGRRLQYEYDRLGIDLFEDCLNINTVNCLPLNKQGQGREPSSEEIAACRARVLKVIAERKPKVIVAFGNAAIFSLIGHRWKKDLGGIAKWRGWTIPDRDFNAWLCPVWEPSFVENFDQEQVRTIWRQDLQRALSLHNVPFPKWEDEKNFVEIVDSSERLLSLLQEISGLVSLDTETNSIKSYSPESKLISFAFSTSEKHAFSFFVPSDKRILRELRRVLTDPEIPKIAHNMKFEHTWIKNKLGYEVKNWIWDTIIASHIIDNRQGITGLKFQTYVNFGVPDYDSDVASYLSSTDSKNSNAINKIHKLLESEEGKRQLLLYNGLDALYTYKLAVKQMKEVQ